MAEKPTMEVRLDWKHSGHEFEAERNGVRTAIDGSGVAGASPVALLLEALGGCIGADVVDILQKGRQELTGLTVLARGERRDEPPRYFERIEVEVLVTGDVDPRKAERAVQLSLDKYCSVAHTLRRDLELDWSVTVE